MLHADQLSLLTSGSLWPLTTDI